MDRPTIDQWTGHARALLSGTGEPSGGAGTTSAAVIAAADFPISPATLLGAPATELYEIRTVAGMVPPSAGEDADRSVGAALEFAVAVRRVGHIVVLAHPGCGLIRCLIDPDAPGAQAVLQGRFLPSWTALVAPSLSRILQASIPEEEQAAICSQEIVRISFENLMTYSWIIDAVFDGRIRLHGWYVDPNKGTFLRFDPDGDDFVIP